MMISSVKSSHFCLKESWYHHVLQIVDAFSCEVLRMYVSGPLHLSLSLLLAYQDKLDQHPKRALGPPASVCSANILGVVGHLSKSRSRSY